MPIRISKFKKKKKGNFYAKQWTTSNKKKGGPDIYGATLARNVDKPAALPFHPTALELQTIMRRKRKIHEDFPNLLGTALPCWKQRPGVTDLAVGKHCHTASATNTAGSSMKPRYCFLFKIRQETPPCSAGTRCRSSQRRRIWSSQHSPMSDAPAAPSHHPQWQVPAANRTQCSLAIPAQPACPVPVRR